MALKQYLEILQDEMKRIDAVTEENLRQYATYVKNVEVHTKTIEQRKRELFLFERMFRSLASPEEYEDNSRHVGCLQDLITEEQQIIDENNEKIETKKRFYDRMKEKEYDRLWENIEAESRLAGLYFGYGDSEKDFGTVTEYFLSTNGRWTEELVLYFLIKVIISIEAGNGEYSEYLNRLIELAAGHGEGKTDKIWDAIWHILGIYAAEDLYSLCSKTVAQDKQALDIYQQEVNSYESANQKVKEAIAQLEKQAKGVVKKEVAQIKKWYNEQTALWQKQLAVSKEKKEKYQSEKTTLENLALACQNNMEEGFSLESIRKNFATANNIIKKSPTRKKELCSNLTGKGEKLLTEFSEKSRALERIKEKQTAEKAQRNAERVRARDRRRKARPANIRTAIACLFIVFTLLLGPIGFTGSPVRNGENRNPLVHNSYTPISVTTARNVGCDVTGPVVFSLASIENLTLYIQTETIPNVITPLILSQDWYIENEALSVLEIPDWVDYVSITNSGIGEQFPGIEKESFMDQRVSVYNAKTLSEIIINEGTTYVSITDCDSVKDIWIPNGVLHVRITDCDQLETIHWPENMDFEQVELYIENNSTAFTEGGE